MAQRRWHGSRSLYPQPFQPLLTLGLPWEGRYGRELAFNLSGPPGGHFPSSVADLRQGPSSLPLNWKQVPREVVLRPGLASDSFPLGCRGRSPGPVLGHGPLGSRGPRCCSSSCGPSSSSGSSECFGPKRGDCHWRGLCSQLRLSCVP